MDRFKQAQQEYESRMFAPFDKGGELFDYEEYEKEKEDYLETQAEYMLEEMAIERFKDD